VDISNPDGSLGIFHPGFRIECGFFPQEDTEEAVKMRRSFQVLSNLFLFHAGGIRKSCFNARSLPEIDCAALRYDKRTYVLSEEDPPFANRIQVLSLTADQKRERNDRLFVLRKNTSADIMALANGWVKEDFLKTSMKESLSGSIKLNMYLLHVIVHTLTTIQVLVLL